MWYVVLTSNLTGTEDRIVTSLRDPQIREAGSYGWGVMVTDGPPVAHIAPDGTIRVNTRLIQYYTDRHPFATEDFNELVEKYPLLAIQIL